MRAWLRRLLNRWLGDDEAGELYWADLGPSHSACPENPNPYVFSLVRVVEK